MSKDTDVGFDRLPLCVNSSRPSTYLSQFSRLCDGVACGENSVRDSVAKRLTHSKVPSR